MLKNENVREPETLVECFCKKKVKREVKKTSVFYTEIMIIYALRFVLNSHIPNTSMSTEGRDV